MIQKRVDHDTVCALSTTAIPSREVGVFPASHYRSVIWSDIWRGLRKKHIHDILWYRSRPFLRCTREVNGTSRIDISSSHCQMACDKHRGRRPAERGSAASLAYTVIAHISCAVDTVAVTRWNDTGRTFRSSWFYRLRTFGNFNVHGKDIFTISLGDSEKFNCASGLVWKSEV
jgi:hypothetical protein